MTESPSVSGTQPDDPADVQCRTVGRAVTGMEIEVVDRHGRRAPVDTIGRIRVRGECVMRGYWRDPGLTATAFDEDGWLATSGLGRIDGDGNLRLAGRASEMYIRGGYNVYPIEVENVLAEHPKVVRAAVVGTPAPVIGEIGVAFVIPADPSEPPTLAELRSGTAINRPRSASPRRRRQWSVPSQLHSVETRGRPPLRPRRPARPSVPPEPPWLVRPRPR